MRKLIVARQFFKSIVAAAVNRSNLIGAKSGRLRALAATLVRPAGRQVTGHYGNIAARPDLEMPFLDEIIAFERSSCPPAGHATGAAAFMTKPCGHRRDLIAGVRPCECGRKLSRRSAAP